VTKNKTTVKSGGKQHAIAVPFSTNITFSWKLSQKQLHQLNQTINWQKKSSKSHNYP
jgi:hypothetical protein